MAAYIDDLELWHPMRNMDSILADLRPFAEYSTRSHDTSKNVHITLLQSYISDSPSNTKGPSVVLLGDDLIADMTTTGESPGLTAPWPSPAMLSDETLAGYYSPQAPCPCCGESGDDSSHESPDDWKRLGGVFNAGVRGDTVQNLVYRLVGDQDIGGDLPGLLPMLAACGTVRVWVVHIGTNNVTPTRHWTWDEEREALMALGRALRQANGGKNMVIMTAAFARRDVGMGRVRWLNRQIDDVSKEMEAWLGIGSTRYETIPYSDYVKMGGHLIDHVHLDLEGYRVWAKKLFPLVRDWLRVVNECHGHGAR